MKHLIWLLCMTVFLNACEKSSATIDDDTPSDTTAAFIPAEVGELNLPWTSSKQDTLGKWMLVHVADTVEPYSGKWNPSFHRVQFPTKDTGYIVDDAISDGSGYQQTIDGGKTWSKLYPIPKTTTDIKFLTKDIGYFFNASYPLITRQEGGIYRLSMNGPAGYSDTWRRYFLSSRTSETRMVDITLANDTLAYSITTYGEFLRIRFPKSSLAWNETKITTIINEGVVDIDRDIRAMQFVDANNGWILTSDWSEFIYPKGTRIYRTTDAGKTWAKIHNNKDFNSKNIFALDSLTLWYTAGASIFKTIDGGKTWTKTQIKKANNTRVQPNKILFLDANHGFLSSLDEMYETKDGGLTWQRSMRAVSIQDFTITNKSKLWVIGSRHLYRLDL